MPYVLPEHIKHLPPPNLIPPGAPTGISRAGCYLSRTNNCSDDLTAEHYVSKSVLQIIGQTAVDIRGYFFQPPGEVKFVGLNALTGKILCSRHNASLSPLDAAAAEFFQLLYEWRHDGSERVPAMQHRFITLNGETIERWMLKVICGEYYAGVGHYKGKPAKDAFALDPSLVIDAFNGKWKPHCGMYVLKREGEVKIQSAFGKSVRVHEASKTFLGGEIYLYDCAFLLLLDTVPNIPASSLLVEGWWHRPSAIQLTTPSGVSGAYLTWPPGTFVHGITMDRISL